MRRLRDEAGMTLVELVAALTVSAIVISGALIFLQQQQRLFGMGTDRMVAVQNYRFAADVLERNLRSVGAGVFGEQPFLVYVDDDAVAFNADFASRVRDLRAVYVDPDAEEGAVSVLRRSHRIPVPRTGSWQYPSVDYANSSAETIVLFFEPDAASDDPDDFVLLRQTNDQEPEVIARGLLRADGQPFFRFLLHVRDGNGVTSTDSIPAADLPLQHWVPQHGGQGDNLAIDSIRAIRIQVASATGQGAERAVTSVQRLVRLPHTTASALKTCGDEPQLGVSLNATLAPGNGAVRLRWNPAVDQAAGEEDVSRYLIWRRVVGTSEWGEPILSVPFNATPFDVVDQNVEPGTSYQYQLRATDCTPSLSEASTSGIVTLP